MSDMKSFDEQMPCIGIFWYDLADHEFFGVRKSELTPKMVEDAAEKAEEAAATSNTDEDDGMPEIKL